MSRLKPEVPRKGTDRIDEALEMMRGCGPEFAGGLANHGPMAAEALVALGRPEEVVPWVEGYSRYLEPFPARRGAISAGDWREALGKTGRFTDWLEFFANALQGSVWRSVLEEWAGRLAAGFLAAATHGVIRTAHAARALGEKETGARLRELAQGLAYWAASYETLPETPPVEGSRAKPSEVVRRIEPLPADRRRPLGFIVEALAPLRDSPPFGPLLHAVEIGSDPSRFLSDLTATFAGIYLANAETSGRLITFIHTVTGPSAIRLLMPHISRETAERLLRYAWQSSAAMYMALGSTAEIELAEPAAEDSEALIDRAVSSGDEHAIKFADACLREHALSPNPVFLVAARHAADRLRAR